MSLESAKEFINRMRFMNDLMESLRNADEKEREKIIRDAGYDFSFAELKQALEEYNDQLVAEVSGGTGAAIGANHKSVCTCYNSPFLLSAEYGRY